MAKDHLVQRPRGSGAGGSRITSRRGDRGRRSREASKARLDRGGRGVGRPSRARGRRDIRGTSHAKGDVARRTFCVSGVPSSVFRGVRKGSCGTSYAMPQRSLHCLRILRVKFSNRAGRKRLIMGGTVTRSILTVFERLCRTRCPVRGIQLISRCSTSSRTSVDSGGSSTFGFHFVSRAAGVSGRNLNVTISVGALCGPCMGAIGKGLSVRPTGTGTCISQDKSFPRGVSRSSLYCGLFAECKFA